MSVSSPLQADLRFLTDVAEELDAARKERPDLKSIDDGREAMLEAVEMLHAFAWNPRRNRELLRRELVWLAAMAARTAVDVLDD